MHGMLSLRIIHPHGHARRERQKVSRLPASMIRSGRQCLRRHEINGKGSPEGRPRSFPVSPALGAGPSDHPQPGSNLAGLFLLPGGTATAFCPQTRRLETGLPMPSAVTCIPVRIADRGLTDALSVCLPFPFHSAHGGEGKRSVPASRFSFPVCFPAQISMGLRVLTVDPDRRIIPLLSPPAVLCGQSREKAQSETWKCRSVPSFPDPGHFLSRRYPPVRLYSVRNDSPRRKRFTSSPSSCTDLFPHDRSALPSRHLHAPVRMDKAFIRDSGREYPGVCGRQRSFIPRSIKFYQRSGLLQRGYEEIKKPKSVLQDKNGSQQICLADCRDNRMKVLWTIPFRIISSAQALMLFIRSIHPGGLIPSSVH